MYYYQVGGRTAVSLSPMPLPEAKAPCIPELFLLDRPTESGPAVFRPSDLRQLTAEAVDVRWLDPARLGTLPQLPESILTAVKTPFPRGKGVFRSAALISGK